MLGKKFDVFIGTVWMMRGKKLIVFMVQLARSYLDTYLDTWSGFEAAKTAPWPSRGLHHCGKFLEPSDE